MGAQNVILPHGFLPARGRKTDYIINMALAEYKRATHAIVLKSEDFQTVAMVSASGRACGWIILDTYLSDKQFNHKLFVFPQLYK